MTTQPDMFNTWIAWTSTPEGSQPRTGETARAWVGGAMLFGKIEDVAGHTVHIRVTDHDGGFYDRGDLVSVAGKRVQVWR